jgi:hypothetical protein
MKRGLVRLGCFTFILFTLLFILSPIIHSEDTITSKVITGEATALTDASIIVGNAGPVVTIHNPKEGRTYRNTSILLNYSALDPDGLSMVWYNLNGTNISLGNSAENYTYFNTSEGSKTLYLYANDTNGLFGALSQSSVNFYVNNTKLIVIYENFRGSYKGNSENFDSYTDEELESIFSMTLENTNYGKITWDDEVNLTAGFITPENTILIDNNVIIENQSIFVNTTEFPNLNNSATLWFYNLTFDNPIVLIDGVVCPDSICFDKLYSNGVLRITVTSFFNFTLEENPEQNLGSVGGGGSERLVKEIDFSYNPELIKISLIQGKKSQIEMEFKSFDTRDIYFNLSLDVHDVSLSPEQVNFILKKDEKKKVYVLFNAESEPGIYSGYLIITARTSDNAKRIEKVPIVFMINSDQGIFDVSLTILPEYKRIFSGKPVYSEIDLYNLGSTQSPVDVVLIYEIRDYEGHVLTMSSESLAVHTKASTMRHLVVPAATKSGTYLFVVNATYNGISVFASDSFLVNESLDLTWLYLILVFLILVLIILYLLKKRKEDKALHSQSLEGDSFKIELEKKQREISRKVDKFEKRNKKLKSFEI